MRECKNCGHPAYTKPRQQNQCKQCISFRQRHGFVLTHEDRAKLNAEPWCHICGIDDDLVIDHCHKTNKVRHYLCRRCNTGIGQFDDNIELMQKAIEYVQQEKQG